MKIYIFRLIIAILAFFIGTTTIYFFAWDNLKNLISSPVIHSAENNSPYSVLEGTTVRVKPYNATFEIPESWLTPKVIPNEPTKNLFLSWQDLNEVNRIDRKSNGFDQEDAQVINAVLPFENCAAHFGNKAWDNGLWNDLQGRIYVTDLTPEEIAYRIENNGLSTAQSVFEEAKLTSGNHESWTKSRFEITDAPTHFILMKRLEFYYRRFDNKTVVFAYLYADNFETTIHGVLNSFKWSELQNQK